MNLLIVEDNKSLANCLRELALDRAWAIIKLAVLEAENLEDALQLLPEADAVLCDGIFPDVPGGLPVCNWQLVSDLAYARAIPFVLFSGDDTMVAVAESHGVLAFRKGLPAYMVVNVLLGAMSLKAGGNRKVKGEQK